VKGAMLLLKMRERLGVSRDAMGGLMGFTRQALWKWEHEKNATPELVARVARAVLASRHAATAIFPECKPRPRRVRGCTPRVRALGRGSSSPSSQGGRGAS